MKHRILFLITVAVCASIFSQQIPLSEFNMSNSTAPAFVLLEEASTEVYVPENLKSLTIHALNNFSESISLEVNPYYFINTKNPNRTFYKYIGVEKKDDDYEQNPFSGITRATTISFAYLDKKFENLSEDERKVYSLGLRTKLFRLYNKKEVVKKYDAVSNVLMNMIPHPTELFKRLAQEEDDDQQQKILIEYYASEEGREYINSETAKGYYSSEDAIAKMREKGIYKPIKPIFQVDGAFGYSVLFEENSISSGTLNRLGAWLTSELSLRLHKEDESDDTNDYVNVFVVARYIEDEFSAGDSTLYYRDFGGKIEFELGKFSLGYEYIKRNGSMKSERSVGNIKFLINKDVSLTGGFGKDFSSEENLVTLFGINWGLNFGSN